MVFVFSLSYIPGKLTEIITSFGIEGGFFSFLYYPLLVIVWISLATALSIASFLLYSLVAAPFIALISEKVIYPEKSPEFSLKLFFHMIRVSLVKLIVFGLLGFFVFILSFIPLLNFIPPLFAALIFAFDSLDYGFEAKGFFFSKRLSFVIKNFSYYLGASLSYLIILSIPALNILLLSFSAAGTAHFIKENSNEP